jgi:hypothetical protein
MRAKAGDDIRQSEPIAESAALVHSTTLFGFSSGNRKIGSGTYGRGTANKMWVSPKFFLFPGIFRLKIEKHSQKISQKNYAECVLDLLLAPSIRRF